MTEALMRLDMTENGTFVIARGNDRSQIRVLQERVRFGGMKVDKESYSRVYRPGLAEIPDQSREFLSS